MRCPNCKPGAVHIGNPRGLIALWLDETDANDVAAAFPHDDLVHQEMGEAVARAYPEPVE